MVIDSLSLFPLSDENLKQKENQAFTALSTDGVVFSFYHRPPR